MSRLSLRVVGSIMGNCLIITDNETEKNVEVMALQLKGILGSEQSTGELPMLVGLKKERKLQSIMMMKEISMKSHLRCRN